MKVLRTKSNGRLGETHFNEDSDIIRRNALKYYPESEIEIIDMTPEDYTVAIAKQNENDMSDGAKIERKIRVEMGSVLRQQAISNLRKRGEL